VGAVEGDEGAEVGQGGWRVFWGHPP
jgi:hypothetical protein